MFSITQLQKELLGRYKEQIELEEIENYIKIWNIMPVNSQDGSISLFDENSLFKLHRGLKLKEYGYCETIIPEVLSKIKFKKSNPINEEPAEERVRRKVEKAIEELKEKVKAQDSEKPAETKIEVEKKITIGNKTNPIKTKPSGLNKASNIIEMKNNVQKPVIEASSPEKTERKETPKSDKLTMVDKLSDTIAEKITGVVLSHLKYDRLLEELLNVSALKRDNEILSKQVKELISANSQLEEKSFNLEIENRSFKKIWKKFYIKLD